jgi:type VI secretion system protein ImpJ
MNRSIPDLIQWHEGLLLTPQHFQQLSSRVESLIQALPAWYVPFHWGVRSFDYDPTDFTAGILTVRTLDAVMPDGLHVSVGGGDQELQLDLRPLTPVLRQSPTLVHLAMPLANGHPQSVLHRFSSYEGEPVVDETTGEGSVSIPRLRPQLSLIAGPQPPARFTSFPLIEIRCEGESFLPTGFTPPSLYITSSSGLGRKCAEVAETLRTKAMELAERAILAPQSPFAGEARSQLHALVNALPSFEAVLRPSRRIRSRLVEACRLAGQSRSSAADFAAGLPAYVHNDPRKSSITSCSSSCRPSTRACPTRCGASPSNRTTKPSARRRSSVDQRLHPRIVLAHRARRAQ